MERISPLCNHVSILDYVFHINSLDLFAVFQYSNTCNTEGVINEWAYKYDATPRYNNRKGRVAMKVVNIIGTGESPSRLLKKGSDGYW
jgi:hypothetical protein